MRYMWWEGVLETAFLISVLSPSLQLPKSSDTAALSGAGFMRLVKNVGDSFSKIAGKKAETDSVRRSTCVLCGCSVYAALRCCRGLF